MKRPARVALASLIWLSTAAGGEAQEADLPPGARLKVLDIVFRVESFGGRVAELQVKETDTEVRIELAADVLFDFDQATLLPDAEATLAQAAKLIRERAARTVRIEGHTDSKGEVAYNQRLSERRAESVRRWLSGNGLDGLELSATGFGEARPVAPNAGPSGADDPEGRRKNRRVEIVIGKRS